MPGHQPSIFFDPSEDRIPVLKRVAVPFSREWLYRSQESGCTVFKRMVVPFSRVWLYRSQENGCTVFKRMVSSAVYDGYRE